VGRGALPISACVIAFNEEANIGACLESLAFCGERLVVDSRSSDRTRALALEQGARVIERDWPGHIAQKNFAIEQATHEWVLCLDADERVTPSLEAAIRALFAGSAGPAADGYQVNRRNLYLGRWIRWGGWYPDRKLRLFRRARGRWRGVNPHDHVYLDPPGAAPVLGDIEHHTYADVSDHLRTIDYFSSIAAAEKLSRGQRFLGLNLVFNPPLKFLKMFVLKGGFLDGWRGLLVAALGAFYVFLRYAKLWEAVHVRGERLGQGGSVTYGRRGERAPLRVEDVGEDASYHGDDGADPRGRPERS